MARPPKNYSWTREEVFKKSHSDRMYPGIAEAARMVEEIEKLGHKAAVFQSTEGFIVIDESDATQWKRLQRLRQNSTPVPGI
jgi:hypothetical protein